MLRPTIDDSELTWFDWKKYGPDALSPVKLEGWVSLLKVRVMLRAQVESDRHEEALRWFDHGLKSDPLAAARDRSPTWEPRHQTDTPSVALLNHVDIADLHSNSRALCPTDILEPYALPGGKFRPQYPDYGLTVPLKVDLAAGREQVVRDFGNWLSRVLDVVPKPPRRNYATSIQEWAESDYLPYFDLKLFADAKKARISDEQMVHLLQLSDSKDFADQLKAPRKSLRVFTLQTLRAMQLQLARQRMNSSCAE